MSTTNDLWRREILADVQYARLKVIGPVIFMFFFTCFTMLVLLLYFVGDAYLMISDFAEIKPERKQQLRTIVHIRLASSLLISISNAIIFAGAFRMRQLRTAPLVYVACVLCLIPGLGLCGILGIPIGIWGFVVMKDPRVKRAFAYEAQKALQQN